MSEDICDIHAGECSPFCFNKQLASMKIIWDEWGGVAPKDSYIDIFSEQFKQYYDFKIIIPRLYPTRDGNIVAKWWTEEWEILLEINLETLIAEYSAEVVKTGFSEVFSLNLSHEIAWQKLNYILHNEFFL